jgi:hypothetical protein
VTDLPERPGREFQTDAPRNFPGPSRFPSDFSGPRVAQTRLTRLRATQFVAEVWARSDSAATRIKNTQVVAEVWTKLFRNTSIEFNRDVLKIGPNSYRGSPFPSFIDALTIATLRDTPAPPAPSVVVPIPDDRFTPKMLGIGRGPFNLVERGRGLGGGGGVAPIVPTVNFVVTQIVSEVWISSPPLPNVVDTQIVAEVWMMSDRNPWVRDTQNLAEVWTQIPGTAPSSVTYTFLWVD